MLRFLPGCLLPGRPKNGSANAIPFQVKTSQRYPMEAAQTIPIANMTHSSRMLLTSFGPGALPIASPAEPGRGNNLGIDGLHLRMPRTLDKNESANRFTLIPKHAEANKSRRDLI